MPWSLDEDLTPARPPRWSGSLPADALWERADGEAQALVARARSALKATPASIAADLGMEPGDVLLLLAGCGNPEDAARLAHSLDQAAAELEALARQLCAAAEKSAR